MFLKKIVVFSFCASALLFAVEPKKEDKSNIERGYRFGEFQDSNSTQEQNNQKLSDEELEALGKDQNNLIKILLLQLKEQQKHTDLLTEIKDILSSEFSPKPKVLTLSDGTKCIENGGDERCNRMPMINEVKKIPVIANAYQNPTEENIKKRELWYAWYTTQVLSDAYTKGKVIMEMGPEYPLSTRPLGTVDATKGWDAPLSYLHKRNLVIKHSAGMQFDIYLGLNKALDMYSLVNLAYVARDNAELKFNLIFESHEAKKHWEKQYKNFFNSKYLAALPASVQPELFKENKVYTTPSLFINDSKNSKKTLIHVGKITQDDVYNKTVEYMLGNKIIERKDLSAQEFWNTEGSDQYIENYYNLNLGIDYEE